MKKGHAGLVLVLSVLLCGPALAVYTAHIGGAAGGTIYVKGPLSGGPDNSPLHESYNLTDEFIDGNPNPDYLGLYAKFIFYDGTLHIDPTGKVGFTVKMWASGNDPDYGGGGVAQSGTVNVEGHLFGPEVRPWKNGCPMEINVWGNGLLECSDILRIGVSDVGVNTGVMNLSGGLVKVNNLDIYGDDSYIDITGGELLINNANVDVAAVDALIAGDKIVNTSGEGLNVTVKSVEGAVYTSVTLVPEPLSMVLLGMGALWARRRRH